MKSNEKYEIYRTKSYYNQSHYDVICDGLFVVEDNFPIKDKQKAYHKLRGNNLWC